MNLPYLADVQRDPGFLGGVNFEFGTIQFSLIGKAERPEMTWGRGGIGSQFPCAFKRLNEAIKEEDCKIEIGLKIAKAVWRHNSIRSSVDIIAVCSTLTEGYNARFTLICGRGPSFASLIADTPEVSRCSPVRVEEANIGMVAFSSCSHVEYDCYALKLSHERSGLPVIGR